MRRFACYPVIPLITMVVLAGGCASTALDAMNEAHRQMAIADAAQAQKYAPETYARAMDNYELAREHFIKGTRRDNKMTRVLSIKAVRKARQAELEARIAAREEEARIQPPTSPEVEPPALETHREQENAEFAASRYIALAQRRVRSAALSLAGAHPPQGFVEIEVWIAPNGQLTQILILQGNPDEELTRTIIRGLQGLKLDSFPRSIDQKYLKLRVTIDTRAQGGRTVQ